MAPPPDTPNPTLEPQLNGTQTRVEFNRAADATIAELKAQYPNGLPAKPSALERLEEVIEEGAGKLPERDPNRKKSGGEVLFDRAVYNGIGFGVNEVSSLWITDQFMHGKPKWYLGGKAFSEHGFSAASDWIAKTFKMPKAKAGNTLLMATLLSGGTLLVLPMRYLEENKISLTKKANHFLDWIKGNKLSKEEVETRDKEVEQAVACSPQQGWGSLLAGRAVAMFASWATGSFLIGKKNNDKIMDFSEKHISNAAKAVGLEKWSKSDVFKRYARLIGVETYSCAESSAVLEVASKFFAGRGTEIHDPEICRETHGPNEKNSKLDPEQFKNKKLRIDMAQKAESAAFGKKVKAEKETAAEAAASLV